MPKPMRRLSGWDENRGDQSSGNQNPLMDALLVNLMSLLALSLPENLPTILMQIHGIQPGHPMVTYIPPIQMGLVEYGAWQDQTKGNMP